MDKDKDRGPKTPTQILLIIVGAAALLFAVVLLLRVARTCDGGVQHHAQGECIGVTDGHFIFADNLKDVEGKIFKENQRIAKTTKEYVSIAVLRPMTGLGAGDETALHALEGAYTAQATANSGSTHERPLIRLLLANDGRDDAQWGPVVDELKQRAGPDSADHLLAVTGFAQSVDGTIQAIKALSHAGIGMVGANITGDNLTGSQYPGLVRVAPTNTDEAAAGVSFGTQLLSGRGLQTVVLVKDTSDRLDDYVATLGDQFSRRLPSGSLTETVDSGVPNPFRLLVPQICAEAAQTQAAFVYFAGRPEPLTAFVNELKGRPCEKYPITIVTGDDASRVNSQVVKEALSSGVTLYYTALAHPEAWSSCPPGSTPPETGGSTSGYEKFKDAFTREFSLDHLDGEAIIGHDAFLTAVNGVRNAATATKRTPLTSLTTRDINAQWTRLHSNFKVTGASGWISIDDASGNPKNKAIPILRIGPDGAVQCVQLAWPEGKPPPAL